MDDLILEKNLKETLNKKSEEIGGSLADQRIRTRVFEAIEEEKNMKHRNWKKTAVAAAAICILGTMTAVAVGRPAFILSGSSRNEIVRDYGQAVQMQEGYDGRVKSVEGFSNGYTFKEAVPKHEETQDEGKNRLDQGVSMDGGRGAFRKPPLCGDAGQKLCGPGHDPGGRHRAFLFQYGQ